MELDFEERLSINGFTPKSGQENGVLLTAHLKDNAKSLSAHELFALENASRFKATAVYFRYFPDGRNAVPQAYIFDNSKGKIDSVKLNELHRKLWSSCVVPLYIIFEKISVKIFDAREPLKEIDSNISVEPFDVFKTAAEAKRQLADLLNTGVFWETESTRNHFNYSTSAYTELISGLKRVYIDFLEKSKLNKDIAIRLLVQSLLIKYLEERDEEEPNGLFAKTFFKNNFKCKNFCDVIRKGELLNLLDKLAEHFNGKIFEWDKETQSLQRNAIQDTAVEKLAYYLDGDNKENQFVLWRMYSFSHLPVELISSVYEELLSEGKKDMVYTPDVVAGTLVDECMPLDEPKEKFKLIDISCGSGIFLVKSYKRIIQWWRLQNKDRRTGKLPHPDKETLKSLLSESIYGVDIEHEATLLTIFSLALALCDELKPSEIWTNLKFNNLSDTNIFSGDFFQYLTSNPATDFDLVIGNPPFNIPNNEKSEEYYARLKSDLGFVPTMKIPDNNIGLTMLVESFKLTRKGGQICLIQPAGPLLYQSDLLFKKKVFGKYNLQQLIDFTFLVDKLWNKATVSTAAIFIQNSPPDENKVAHLVLHRTKTNINRLYFEIDHYDFHFITKQEAVNNPFVWKANLVGGSRLIPFVKRLSGLRTLGNFLVEKETEEWKTGVGFIEKGKKNKADFITGQKYLPTDAFTEEGIDKKQIDVCEIKYFHSTGDPLIYSPPHILFKANIGNEKFTIHYSNEYLVFRDKIIGIHAPKKQETELKELYQYLGDYSDLLRAYTIATSSQLIIGMNTAVLKKDFMQCPYPENLKDLKTSVLEKNLLKEVIEHFKNATVKNKLERRIADENNLRDYSKTFCGILNSIYKIDSKQFSVSKILDAGAYYALQFDYAELSSQVFFETDSDLEKYFKELIEEDNRNRGYLKLQRILKLYTKDKVVFVKPKNLRYWLHITAARDADETVADYIKAGF
jgi:hypothetical protein